MLVERFEQLETLHSLLSEARSGKGRLACLEGPFASGKTALLREFAEQAAAAGVAVLSGTCFRDESDLPFGLLRQLFRAAGPDPALAARVDRLLVADIRPEPAGDGRQLEPRPTQHLHEQAAMLLDLAGRQPLLIAVDDLRHADLPSLHCLLHLIRRLGAAPLMLLVTDTMDVQPRHPSLRAELLRQPDLHRLRVGPLSGTGTRHLLAQHLDPMSTHRLAARFHALSGGNPLLLRALLEDHDQARTNRAAGYGLALAGALHRGDLDTVPVARALAVLGPSATAGELSRLTGVPRDRVEQSLDAMTAAAVLTDGFFRHPEAGAALLNELSARERAELNLSAARMLHDQGADATRVAHHLVETGQEQPWAADLLGEAAELALQSDRAALAVASLTLAQRSAGAPDQRAETVARLAQVEWQTDRAASARHLPALTEAAREDLLSAHDKAAVLRQLLWHGRSESAAQVLTGLREQQAPAGESAAVLHDVESWLLSSHPQLARPRQSRRYPGDRRAGTAVLGSDPWLNRAASLADRLERPYDPESVHQAERVLQDIKLNRTSFWVEESAALALLTLLCADKLEAAEYWCDQLTAEPQRYDAPTWRPVFTAVRAEVSLRRGRLGTAIAQASEALTELPEKAWGVAVGLPLGTLVLAATRMGSLTEVAELLARPVPDQMFESRHGLPYLYARGCSYLLGNHHHAALADFLACGDLVQAWGLDQAGLVPWRIGAAEAWLRLGNKDQAKHLLHDQLAHPGTEGTRTRGHALRLFARVCPPNRRTSLLNEALDLLEASGDRFEVARVLADLSRTHDALGDPRRARLLLRQALHVATTCGAHALVQELLSGSDESVERIPLGGDQIAALSGSERRVASLAVMGYTNREIAGRLYVTPSTVEQHLTRVFRKLNVKRRADLPTDLWTTTSKAG
ncbi:helix-turn-helix transcriptional regulator [Kitasatospora mediocidica]|uniref:helix-turn-helix transcriptional regulator n=1 Tax=Kitasatospora mediocidica TaxID=58352 RepID=UPI00055E4CF8|nr:LuxR family transcriptional regulator [Kitasatospora mediocidica]